MFLNCCSATWNEASAVSAWKLQVMKLSSVKITKANFPEFQNTHLGSCTFSLLQFLLIVFQQLFLNVFCYLPWNSCKNFSTNKLVLFLLSEGFSVHKITCDSRRKYSQTFKILFNKQNGSQTINFLSILSRFPSKFRLETQRIDDETSRDFKTFFAFHVLALLVKYRLNVLTLTALRKYNRTGKKADNWRYRFICIYSTFAHIHRATTHQRFCQLQLH